MAKRKQYLLQNVTAGYLGNSPMFWSNNGGYTQWIDDAKVWGYKEAREQIRSTKGSHVWKLWPLDLVLKLARRTIDVQDFPIKPTKKK
jgi:hypothetical protein